MTPQVDVFTERTGVLEHGIETQRRLAVERLIEVQGGALTAEGTAHQSEFVQRSGARLLGYAIDHAAPAATPEDHGVRTLERLHAIEIVQVPEVLHVVAYAIEEKIGRCGIAADR